MISYVKKDKTFLYIYSNINDSADRSTFLKVTIIHGNRRKKIKFKKQSSFHLLRFWFSLYAERVNITKSFMMVLKRHLYLYERGNIIVLINFAKQICSRLI